MRHFIIKRLLLATLLIGAGGTGGYLFTNTSENEDIHTRVIVDAGHGSKINNNYQTFGKQSPTWECGLKIYEGVSNKQMAYELVNLLTWNNIDVQLLNPELEDVALSERVRRVNEIYDRDNRTILISLHHDAQPIDHTADYEDLEGLKGWTKGGANHIIVFTSIGCTESDVIAEYIAYQLDEAMEIPVYIREANYYILRKTKCPAVLIEFGFMTSYESCKLITSQEGRESYVTAITNGLLMFNLTRKRNEKKN